MRIDDQGLCHRHICQETLDKLVVDFVVNGSHPFSIVEEDSFVRMLQYAAPMKKVLTRRMLATRIEDSFTELKQRMQDTFRTVQYVTVTADCWSSHHRHFLGVMALWLETDNLQRKIATLACRRMIGNVTYDKLAQTMNSILEEYGLHGKVTKVVTDNGSNFVKTFRCFGLDTDDAFEHFEVPNREERELHTLLDEGDTGLRLPPHQRCAAHTFKLIATVDASRAEMDPDYRKVSEAVFKKCSALWSKEGQSARAAGVVKGFCGRYLRRPVPTRWNSLYDSLECIIRVIDEGKDIDGLCRRLNVPVLQRSTDIKFIEEYCKVMQPLCTALDILLGDKHMFVGYLLPTVSVVTQRLQYEGMKGQRFCGPLVTALLDGIQRRFEHLMEDKELLLAAAVFPHFKISWLTDITRREIVTEMLKKELCDVSTPATGTPTTTTSSSTDDFFAFTRQSRMVETAEDSELTKFLRIEEDYPLSRMKENFPRVHELFLRVNTAVPSSASVERLFSSAADIFTRKRTSLSDTSFEYQLLLKCNSWMTLGK
ncbi:uncharacterized protein LOC135368470 isoform X2 [Ornithodoros turicata]